LVVAILPESNFSIELAAIGAWVALTSGLLCGLTFWAKARVGIGGMKFRYKIVRRNAALVAAVAFAFPLVYSVERRHSSAPDASNRTSNDPDAVVIDCFCSKLKTERHAEALEPNSEGVPSTDWPNVNALEKECIQPRLNLDQKQSEDAWLHARFLAPLQNPDGGVAGCTAAGYSVDESTPEPASADLMNSARQAFCQDLEESYEASRKDNSAPSTDPKVVEAQARADSAVIDAKFAARFHISDKLADTVLNRAAAEMKPVGKFAFECRDGAVVPPHTNFRERMSGKSRE
jgi:hypothetical protein